MTRRRVRRARGYPSRCRVLASRWRPERGGAMVLAPEMLRCYVPAFLASRFLARSAPLDAPGMERFPAAVLFADISGFTPLAERLARRGPASAEDLSGL